MDLLLLSSLVTLPNSTVIRRRAVCCRRKSITVFYFILLFIKSCDKLPSDFHQGQCTTSWSEEFLVVQVSIRRAGWNQVIPLRFDSNPFCSSKMLDGAANSVFYPSLLAVNVAPPNTLPSTCVGGLRRAPFPELNPGIEEIHIRNFFALPGGLGTEYESQWE